MDESLLSQLLSKVEEFARSHKLSRKDMAKKLGIPCATFERWFAKGNSRRDPSKGHIAAMEQFLESQRQSDARWTDLWKTILKWWETQHKYRSFAELADEIGWNTQDITGCFQSRELPPRLVVERIAESIGFGSAVPERLTRVAHHKSEKIKQLLIFLEEELGWFRDGPKERRSVFRSELNADDIGYVASLLTMMEDEDKFQRWLRLTTNRFSFFGKK